MANFKTKLCPNKFLRLFEGDKYVAAIVLSRKQHAINMLITSFYLSLKVTRYAAIDN